MDTGEPPRKKNTSERVWRKSTGGEGGDGKKKLCCEIGCCPSGKEGLIKGGSWPCGFSMGHSSGGDIEKGDTQTFTVGLYWGQMGDAITQNTKQCMQVFCHRRKKTEGRKCTIGTG